MSSSHIFFIPGMLLLGAVCGYFFGRRLLLNEQAERERADERKAARRARREAAEHI